MTAFQTITLNDGQGTPVAHTFKARRIDAGIAKWQDVSSGVAQGFITVTASLREPVKGSKIPTYKAELNLYYPKLETYNAETYNGITPAPAKAYDCVAKLTFLLPERSSTSDRQDIRAFMANALAQSDIKAMIEDLDFVF
jgi:hypothetical protein